MTSKKYHKNDRLHAIMDLDIIDSPQEERFDILTKEATKLLNVPIATISLINEDTEWEKSVCGLDECSKFNGVSLCENAIHCDDIYVVENTLHDEEFKNHPHVVGAPFIRFYAGIPLKNRKLDIPVGVFCVKDTKPRKLNVEEIAILMTLAEKAEQELNYKK